MVSSVFDVGEDTVADIASPTWSSVGANSWATQNYEMNLTEQMDYISQIDLHGQQDSRDDLPAHSAFMDDYPNICDDTLATIPAKTNISTPRCNPKPTSKGARRKTRTSRACDQCNISRIKCNGQQPCVRCVDFELECAYKRPRKKRARVAKEDGSSTNKIPEEEQSQPGPHHSNSSTDAIVTDKILSCTETNNTMGITSSVGSHEPTSTSALHDLHTDNDNLPISKGHLIPNGLELSESLQYPPNFQFQKGEQDNGHGIVDLQGNAPGNLNSMDVNPNSGTQIDTTNNPNTDGKLEAQWTMDLSGTPTSTDKDHKYPVLQPLFPYLKDPLNPTLAYTLLEGYFLTAPGGYIPSSPFLLGHMLRRRSFLRHDCPRKCSPALLASILWVAAETTDEPFSTLPPTTRSKVCQTLLDLTLALLQPVSGAQVTIEARRGLPLTQHSYLLWNADCEALDATGSFDDVITFVHLATVISAGKYKSACFRWWHSALQLAKELRLNHEMRTSSIPGKNIGARNNPWDGFCNTVENTAWFSDNYHLMLSTPAPPLQDISNTMPLSQAHMHDTASPATVSYIAEEREERRRVWWTLYILDRHLALSFNSPLVIREVDCEGILFPDSEDHWQEPEIYCDHDSTLLRLQQWSSVQGTQKASSVFQLSHGTFTFFIPLMSILGQIIDFQHARSHPQLGKIYREDGLKTRFIQEVSIQLDTYKKSLGQLTNMRRDNSNESELFNRDSGFGFSHTSGESMNHPVHHEPKFDLYEHTVAAYGNFFVHVMHILLHGKWDLTLLFEEEHSVWMSQPAFLETLNHVIAAADSLDNILEFDLDFSHNPYLLGIYLLQGSFIPFVVAAKCQNRTSPAVLKACESFVRAHEICMATLHTDYQRKYQQLMRSTIASAKGRNNKSSDDELKRQREILTLYRWAGNGMALGV